EAMVRTFRYASAAELVGQDYLIFLAPEEHARIEGYRAARLRGEPAPSRYETRGRRKDGAPIWIEILVTVVAWEGRPAVLGTFLDITERKRAEATEREALALRSVTQLANAAAHEINNPLSIIVGHLEMLARDVDLHAGARPRPAPTPRDPYTSWPAAHAPRPTPPCRAGGAPWGRRRGPSTGGGGPARGARRPSPPRGAWAAAWRGWLTPPGRAHVSTPFSL